MKQATHPTTKKSPRPEEDPAAVRAKCLSSIPDFGAGGKPAARTALHVAAALAAFLDDSGESRAAMMIRRAAPELARGGKE